MAHTDERTSVIEIPSVGDRLADVRRRIGEIAADCGFSASEIFDIKVAVSEACANAVQHGSPRGSANHIRVTCECAQGEIAIKITDEGRFKRELPGLSPTNTNYRGRGILIMLALMDKVSIDESEEGTTVHLSKHHVDGRLARRAH